MMLKRVVKSPISLAVLLALHYVAGSAAVLPNGVAAGDATQDSAVLWARSNNTGAMPFEISTAADFSTLVGGAPIAGTVTDVTLPVKAQVSGLTPGTTYYYRATDSAGNQSTGTFRTPSAAGVSDGLRLGVFGDWRQDLTPYPAVNNAPGRNLDAALKLGDTIYADVPSTNVSAAQATTLADYRAKHEEAISSTSGLNAWANLNQTTQIYATIDDHEVTNDFAGAAPIGSDSRFSAGPGPLINNSQLYQNGLQAFQEYMPINAQTYSGTGNASVDGRPDLYRNVTFGRDASMFVLDSRSFRDQELAAPNPTDPTSVGTFLAQSFDPTRTMLGAPQLAQLKSDLLAADKGGVTWKFIAVPEPIQNLGVLGASDRFEGYAAERTDLLKFIRDNDIRNTVFISADIHGSLVNNLTYQTSAFGPQISANSFEVSVPAVAYNKPFGQTVVDLATAIGLLTPAQQTFFYTLSAAAQDQFIKNLVDSQLSAYGYDHLGLAGSGIDAHLLVGDYLSTVNYGWTEFDIAPGTQQLTVTTYGLPAYSSGNANITASPVIISQFLVNAQVPEPESLALFAIALAGWASVRKVVRKA
jgi:phosphodiesterase/alkaline phosphatase D-like protein